MFLVRGVGKLQDLCANTEKTLCLSQTTKPTCLTVVRHGVGLLLIGFSGWAASFKYFGLFLLFSHPRTLFVLSEFVKKQIFKRKENISCLYGNMGYKSLK